MAVISNFKIHPHHIELIKKQDLYAVKTDLDEKRDIRVKINLKIEQDNYNFPSNSLVQIHLKKGGEEQVFDIGTWGNIQQYSNEINFNAGLKGISYMITVTENLEDQGNSNCRYIGRSSWCKPIQNEAASFFDTKITDELGDVPWSFDFPQSYEMHERSTLFLNSKIDYINDLPLSSTLFYSTFITAFFREMLYEIIRQDLDGINNEESWHFDVFQVCKGLDEESSNNAIEGSKDDQKRWADHLVETFAEAQEFVQKINEESNAQDENV